LAKPKLFFVKNGDTIEIPTKITKTKESISLETIDKYIVNDSTNWLIEFPVLVLLGDKLQSNFTLSMSSLDCFENKIENSFVELNNICIFSIRQVDIIEKMPFFEVFPNPSSDEIKLNFLLLGKEDVNVKATDYLGREITIFDRKDMAQGEYSVNVKNNILINGLYVLSLNIGNTTITTNLIISK
jgi:hypothetical protein